MGLFFRDTIPPMKNLDLYLTSDGRVSMSLATYVEIRMSLIPHGETDLPEYPASMGEDGFIVVHNMGVGKPFIPDEFDLEE